MKKTLLYITASLALLLVLGGCTHNGGDIGPWFGTWRVVGIAGNAPLTNEGNYFFQFQSKVFRVSQVGGHEQVVESYGIWEESDDGSRMTITFPEPEFFYVDMPGLETHNDFTVTTTSSKEVALTKTDAAGNTYVYRLQKQP